MCVLKRHRILYRGELPARRIREEDVEVEFGSNKEIEVSHIRSPYENRTCGDFVLETIEKAKRVGLYAYGLHREVVYVGTLH